MCVTSKIFEKHWRYIELYFLWVYREIPVFIMFWIKFCTMVKHSPVNSVLELSGALTTDLDLDRVQLTLLLLILLTKWQFWQLSLKWLSGAHAQDKTKWYYCCFFFFQDFIQFYASRKIHYLTHEFRVKWHLKTDIAHIASQCLRYRFWRAI